MTNVYHLPATHPHEHIRDQHDAAWYESQAADRIGWAPPVTRDLPPEEWRAGVHYDVVGGEGE